jgi:hypothetical protein
MRKILRRSPNQCMYSQAHQIYASYNIHQRHNRSMCYKHSQGSHPQKALPYLFKLVPIRKQHSIRCVASNSVEADMTSCASFASHRPAVYSSPPSGGLLVRVCMCCNSTALPRSIGNALQSSAARPTAVQPLLLDLEDLKIPQAYTSGGLRFAAQLQHLKRALQDRDSKTVTNTEAHLKRMGNWLSEETEDTRTRLWSAYHALTQK